MDSYLEKTVSSLSLMMAVVGGPRIKSTRNCQLSTGALLALKKKDDSDGKYNNGQFIHRGVAISPLLPSASELANW